MGSLTDVSRKQCSKQESDMCLMCCGISISWRYSQFLNVLGPSSNNDVGNMTDLRWMQLSNAFAPIVVSDVDNVIPVSSVQLPNDDIPMCTNDGLIITLDSFSQFSKHLSAIVVILVGMI